MAVNEPIKVLWVIPVADLAGVARHVLDVTGRGIPGFQVTVLCPEGPLAEQLRLHGASVRVGPFGPEVGLWRSRQTLRETISELQPDIIHSHLAFADIVCALVTVPRHSIRVSTEHGIAGDDSVYQSSRLRAYVMRKVHQFRLRSTRGVISVSKATREAMQNLWNPRTEIVVISNGVDLPELIPGTSQHNPAEPLRLLSLSRLAPEKRIDLALRAFAEIQQIQPDARCVIAGEGPELEALQELVLSLKLEHVTFPGFLDSEQAMTHASVLVQLSTWENCSYTLLDARARNMGIVASNVGGNPEILASSQLVDVENISSVAEAILNAHNTIPEMNFTWISVSDMCDSIAEAYSSWLPQNTLQLQS